MEKNKKMIVIRREIYKRRGSYTDRLVRVGLEYKLPLRVEVFG